jgi:hypothetical protein
VDGHAGGQPQQGREDSAPHLLGTNDSQVRMLVAQTIASLLARSTMHIMDPWFQ